MKDPHDVIIRPVVSEKSYALLDSKVYTFIVAPSASKPEIRAAVQSIWPDVRVSSVNTMNRKGKTKRGRRSAARAKLPDTKRAVITLSQGEIDVFTAG